MDDAQIERYSRQLVLAEIGPRGQARLLAARVAVTVTGVAGEHIVAYLAGAGVGTLAVASPLAAFIDPAHPDVHVEPITATSAPYDVAVADALGNDPPAARRTFWVAHGRAAETPPCPTCATAVVGDPPLVPPELTAIRDAVVATLVATEAVKALLEIGTPLRGRVVTYDPVSATIVSTAITPTCDSCRAATLA